MPIRINLRPVNILYIVFSTLIFLCYTPYYAQHLSIDISNIKPEQNSILYIALYDHKDAYDNNTPTVGKKIDVKSNSTITAVFNNLSPGFYVVSCFQDLNNNGAIDFHPFGFPKEAFGFSNNVIGLFGKPSFEQAKFTVSEHTQTHIKLR